MKFIFLLFALISSIYAMQKVYIINHSGLIDNRAHEKINSIGDEVQKKLDTEIYLDVKGNNGINLSKSIKQRILLMNDIEKNMIKNIRDITKKQFVILSIALDQKYANILFSNEQLKNIINRDDVLDEYVIPLLAAKDKNTLKSKVSAAVLNGYAQIGDILAYNKNIELKSSIGNAGKVTSSIWKVFIYTLVVIGLIAYVVVIMRERKYKKR
jgi:hypothetical protein